MDAAYSYDPLDAWDDKCHRCGGAVWYGDQAIWLDTKQLHFDCLKDDERPRCEKCGEDIRTPDYVRVGVDRWRHEECGEETCEQE
jgi:hypothetical protein